MWVKDEYLQQILEGRKTIEVRVAYNNITRLQAGDRLVLNEKFPFIIQHVGLYSSFEELLSHEDPAAIAPDIPLGELLGVIRTIYPAEKEALGVVALRITPES
jgi:ASC-1-like (ASCH) protein